MRNNFSIKTKLFTLFAVVIVISTSAIGWFGFKSAKDAYINSTMLSSKGQLQSLAKQIKGLLDTIPEDVLYNKEFYALEKLLIWEDLKEPYKTKKWSGIYKSAMIDYLQNKKLYYQIRVLDENGIEKLVLKYDESTGNVRDTPDKKLQNKSQKTYFKNAIHLHDGQFYISVMNLNVEHGVVERPFVPVVRYSTPIIDANGEIKGVIVLNFSANKILDMIQNAQRESTTSQYHYFLLNENGDYLYNKNADKRWGFQLGHRYKFQNDFGTNILKKFENINKSTFHNDKQIVSVLKIYPDKEDNPNRFWYLVNTIDEDIALSALDKFVQIFFIILSLVLLLGLYLVNRYVTGLTNPLFKVTAQLKALSHGDIDKREINYHADDEIGQIVQSTSIVVNAIERTIDQANAVANGDFTKDLKLLSKNDKLGLAISDMTKRLKEITVLSKKLSVGNYDAQIIVKSNDDELGLALIQMVSYLENITKLAESISVGDINVKYKVKSDKDRLGSAIVHMTEYLQTILKQAHSISNNDFSSSIEPKGKSDDLGLALVRMTDMLRSSYIKNREEMWFSDGVGEFSDKLTGINDTQLLSKQAITTLSRYVNASSGVIYSYDEDSKLLKMIASFAYTSRDNLSNEFKIGEGVVGQVALEKEPILLKNIRDESFEVQSGTTLAKAKEVYAFPLLHEGELFGVVEIMSFETFTKLHKEYLLRIAEILTSTLNATMQNSQIKELLIKSQEAFEELQIKSEELQESNVQMEEQQQQLTEQSQELKIKNQNLEEAKKEIDQRADDLEKASKYKSEFLANMSHELRTPLNSIILLSKLLSHNPEGKMSEEDREKAEVIHKAGNDLLLLINDILDLSKVESGNMELIYEDVETSEIVENIKGLFSDLANEKNLQFKIDDKYNALFSTDKVKLLQVLKNLLSNAFKFTKEGFVTLTFEEIDSYLHIKVEDSGIGIPSDKLGTIFEAFKQVDGTISREFGGTGLGLSITKTIVELMQGSVKVESKEGEGTAFIVSLPLNKEVSKKVEANEVEKKRQIEPLVQSTQIISEDESYDFEEATLSGNNILIVDDDSRNIFSLTAVLEDLGADVYSAFNGKEALEILHDASENIDLILMDIMMPVMDGLKAIESIKSNSDFKNIPIIAVTAKTMQEDKEKCLEAGANDYLAKPLDNNALTSMIKAWIK